MPTAVEKLDPRINPTLILSIIFITVHFTVCLLKFLVKFTIFVRKHWIKHLNVSENNKQKKYI